MLFLCDAIYRGSEVLEGAVSPNKLTALVELVLTTTQEPGKRYSDDCIDKLPRGERCQLQIDEERLRISKSRRDEGFESDSESSSASGSLIEENVCGSPEIKVIQDHVLRLEKLLRQDSGIHHCTAKTSDGGSASISSSSGAESEEEAPKRLDNVDFSSNVTSQDDSRKVTAIQADNGSGDHFLLSDILFCHVMTHRPKIVTIVVKSIDSPLVAAHLFECLSQEAARTLYNCYYTASNKYKLNRYRKSKRRIEPFDTEDKAVLDRINVSIRNVNKKKYNAEEHNREAISKSKISRLDENEINIRKTFKNEFNGDTNNINIIEIKDSHLPVRVPNGMLQKTDENGVTHIEIESAPCSMIDSIQESKTLLRTTFDSQEVLSALDRLSLHSSFNPESYFNSIGVTGSCPNSITEASREIFSTGDKEREKKLRQRQPPLLLKKDNFRKLDSLPRKEIRKTERKSRFGSDEHSEDNTQTQSEHFSNSNPNKDIQRSKELENKSEIVGKTESHPTNSERQSRLRNTSKDKGKFRSNHNKGPAPPPPPKINPNNPSLILVPTKSGQEKTKSYYPKESHIVRGSKLVRIDYPLYPPWNMNSDINNNPKRLYYAHRSWVSSNEYHSNRYKGNTSLSSEIRKRSRSKSPAKRPMAHRYIDVVSTFNLSQKIKEFSDNVIQSWKNNAQSSQTISPFISNRDTQERSTFKREKKASTDSQSSNNSDALKPVIKRGKKIDNNQDSKRVTFSAFATVQLMES